jgi:tyrosine-specific transport protein
MISHLSTRLGLAPRTLTGALLVAGTCIGGGMLALPVVGAPAGLIPALLLMVIVWILMSATGLCLVEIGFWMKKSDAHIITMASTILGRWGKWLMWFLFLFISYASLTAYTAGCGSLMASALSALLKTEVPKTVGCVLFVLIFGPFLLGPRYILGRANNVLFLLMICAYLAIVGRGVGLVQMEYLVRQDWRYAYLAVPLIITAFSYQMMVPSLHPFLDHDKKSLKVAVILGTTIAFIVYALWQVVVFGSVPLEGASGLSAAFKAGEPATFCLSQLTNSTVVTGAASFFALFALVTSFFGIGIGLFDFLGDGLGIQRKGRGAIVLGMLVLIPSLIFAISFERIFLIALDVSGGFGDTILNGVVPLLMLWLGVRRFAPHLLRHPLMKKGLILVLLGLFALAFAAEVTARLTEEALEDVSPPPVAVEAECSPIRSHAQG